MTTGRPSEGAARALADFAGAALLRRGHIRNYLQSRFILLPVMVLLAGTPLHLAFTLDSPGTLPWFALLPAGALLQILFWLIAVAAALEPVLTILIGLAEDDPLLLHWSQERRPQTRTAILLALAVGILLRGLLAPWLGLAGDLIAFLYAYFLMARILSTGWRFRAITSLVLAAIPALLTAALAIALAEPVVAAATALASFPLLWVSVGDIRAQVRMNAAVERLFAQEKPSPADLEALVSDVISHRTPNAARRIIEREDLKLAAGQRVALLTTAGNYLEACEAGSRAMEAGETGAALHLALAEACLRADDPEDAAAHAEEAYELGGDPHAMVLLAVACFGMGERESGAAACIRVLALERKGGTAKAAVRQAKTLLRFAHTIDFQPE